MSGIIDIDYGLGCLGYRGQDIVHTGYGVAIYATGPNTVHSVHVGH